MAVPGHAHRRAARVFMPPPLRTASTGGAVAPRVRREPPEDRGEGRDLAARELVEEALADGREMGRLGRPGEGESLRGELRVDRARVAGTRLALDERALLEGIDDPRDAAEAESGLAGEHREPQPGVGGARQPREQLE